MPKKSFSDYFTPSRTMIFGFALLIILGGFLLTLPFSSESGEFTNPIDALFTATSATCVTGLIVQDTGIYWSSFGKGVIIALIQIGGLGFMSLAMMFSLLLKRRVSPRERLMFTQSVNLPSVDKPITFVKRMLIFAFSFEGVGALLLSFKFIPEFGWRDGIIYSIFHSISAFCNAGFDILGGYAGEYRGLAYFAKDPYVCGVIALLVICGGLGFIVWNEIYAFIKRREKLSLYSGMVLGITAFLLLFGTAFFAFEEWNNPQTLGGFTPGIKLSNAFFQSVTLRTAGFSTLNQGGLSGISKLISMLFMFIGGSSGSTAGGIKTVTFGILIISAFRHIMGAKDVNIGKRRIEESDRNRAQALFVISSLAVLIGIFIIQISDSLSLADTAFEVFSAFGTVGITVGITPSLSAVAKLTLIALMFFGRVGIVTITYEIIMRISKNSNVIRYPKAKMLIG